MSRQDSGNDRLALAVAAGVLAILAREARARLLELDLRLQPMRQVIDAFERSYGPDAQPADHPQDFANLVARPGAGHLRERDIQLLLEASVAEADHDGALGDALDDLDAARDATGKASDRGGEPGLLTWVGVTKEQYVAAVDTALRHQSQSR
jgi:hypothetical protein